MPITEQDYIDILKRFIVINELVALYKFTKYTSIIYINEDGFICHDRIQEKTFDLFDYVTDDNYIVFKRANVHIKLKSSDVMYEVLYMSDFDIQGDGFCKIAVISGGIPDLITVFMNDTSLDYTINNFTLIDKL